MQDDHNEESNAERNMYMQFNLVLSDVSAFLVDGDYSWNQKPLDGSSGESTLLPVIDRCGVSLHLQQVMYCSFDMHVSYTSYLLSCFMLGRILQENFVSLSDSAGESIISFNKACCTTAIIGLSLFSSSIPSIDADNKDLSEGGC